MVYDFGPPSHYYCIVKEIYDPDEIDDLLAESDRIVGTDTASIIDEKRPLAEQSPATRSDRDTGAVPPPVRRQ